MDDETRLVRAARAGDREAFARLLARHQSLLLGLCRRMLGDRDLAEDASQEAALLAFLSLDRLRRPERFGPWLCGIGLNVCRRWLRYRSRDAWSWEALTGGWRAAEPVDPQPGPETLAEAADLRARVRHAADALPPGQRAAVLLVYLSGLTLAEAAVALEIEVGAVKTRLHKARATLRRRLWTSWQEETMMPDATTHSVEVRVTDVRRAPAEGEAPPQHVVLEEVNGTRRLPIWIGPFEAEALALTLERVAVPRPLPYALMAKLIEASGGQLHEVRITRLEQEVFYATVAVTAAGKTTEVDAPQRRPQPRAARRRAGARGIDRLRTAGGSTAGGHRAATTGVGASRRGGDGQCGGDRASPTGSVAPTTVARRHGEYHAVTGATRQTHARQCRHRAVRPPATPGRRAPESA